MSASLRAVVRRVVPRPWRKRLRTAAGWPVFLGRYASNVLHDARRYARWSSASGRTPRPEQLRAWIAGDAHKIEKALSFSSPRPGFGKAVIRRLIENLEEHEQLHGWNGTCDVAVDCLTAYDAFNRGHGIVDAGLTESIREFRARHAAEDRDLEGGWIEVSAEEIHARGRKDLRDFFESRYSVRDFDPRPVDPELIEKAVAMAQKTPTVCNRQSLKVWSYHADEDKKKVLACQLGNAGFGHLAGAVLVVTCDVQTFFSIGERNQCWIDGGLFSMSLVYALHSIGLGSCCLNWSVDKENDVELRRVTGIPPWQAVIMMIAVGHLPERLKVARSVRRPLDEVLIRSPTR